MAKRKVYELVSTAGVVKVFRDTDWDTWEVVGYAPWLGMKRWASIEEDSLAFAKDAAAVMETELAAEHARHLKESQAAELAALSDAELVDSIAKLRGLGMNTSADELQAELDARKVELPTEADLAYLDAQAEAMGVPAQPVQDGAFDIVHDYGVPVVNKAGPTIKQVRINIFIDGLDYDGVWSDLNLESFRRQCSFFARQGIPFSVEYRERAL